jgi:hypothetical protein
MEFVNRDFHAIINIRKCAVLKMRPKELTRVNFVGQPLRIELYNDKLKPIAWRRSKKVGMRLHAGINLLRFCRTFGLRSAASQVHSCRTRHLQGTVNDGELYLSAD